MPGKVLMNARIPEFIQPDRKGASFNYGNQKIFFERKNRLSAINKVKIKVQPDCRVEVLAPNNASDDEVLIAVKKRRRWIYKQLKTFAGQIAYVTPRKYVSGEGHYYLGRQYMLKVKVAKGSAGGVKLFKGQLDVTVKNKNTETIKAVLNDWYRARAKEVFAARLTKLLEQALWVDNIPPTRILAIKTQWGSCSPSGRLTLNPSLVKAPRDCIDYVILHELCHLAEHNHSERFYRLMGRVMPNWERIKLRLDESAYKYLAES